jgi:hypothetical protein
LESEIEVGFAPEGKVKVEVQVEVKAEVEAAVEVDLVPVVAVETGRTTP